jgi:hypothetical protein
MYVCTRSWKYSGLLKWPQDQCARNPWTESLVDDQTSATQLAHCKEKLHHCISVSIITPAEFIVLCIRRGRAVKVADM